jgi:integrase
MTRRDGGSCRVKVCQFHPQWGIVLARALRSADDIAQTDFNRLSAAGGELEQIQLLLGHASVQTTERYLGTKQDLVHAPSVLPQLFYRVASSPS